MDETMSVNTPSRWFGTDTSLNLLDDLGATGLSNSAALQPKTALFQGHSDPWAAQGGRNFVGFPLTEDTPALSSIPTLQQLSTVSHQQDLLSGAESLDMMYASQDSDDMLNVDFLKSSESPSNLAPVQPLSATTLLRGFGEKLERHVSAMGAFLSDPRNLVEDCAADSMSIATDNPVAVILTCTQKLTEIIQNLTASTRPAPTSPSQFTSPTASSVAQLESLSTETTLLILSSFLQLMKLYDSLFHDVYQNLSQVSAQTIKSIKVKAVLRIGGLSSLQDLPVKAYAVGIVEVIQSHIQTLERCMGLPAAYCLLGEAAVSPTGIFADADRARLLHGVMAQEDVRSLKGNKSYVESIRENIKNSLALFGE